MNIYLTSYGLDTRYKEYMNSYQEIIELLTNKKVVIIPNAKLADQNRTNSLIAKEELEKNHIGTTIIDLNEETCSLEEIDALYLSGGEPKYLMDAIYNANLFEKIENFINQGGIVIGQSAGAMIFNHEYLDTTTEKLLVQHNGFSYADKMIVPHYDHLPKKLIEQIPEDVIKIKDNDKLIQLKLTK